MENIIIIPESERQLSVLKAFLAEMKVKFTTTKQEADDTQMTEEAFYARIDLAIKQAEAGEVIEYTPEIRAKLFNSIL